MFNLHAFFTIITRIQLASTVTEHIVQRQDSSINCLAKAKPGVAAVRQFAACGFLWLPQVLDKDAIGEYNSNWKAVVASRPERINELAFAPRAGDRIYDRAVVQLPFEVPGLTGLDAADVVAPPAIIAVMDAYFGEQVELDSITVVRNHGCAARPECGDAFADPRPDGGTPGGYLWLGSPNVTNKFGQVGEKHGYHYPCCNDEGQEFHRDLESPGTITVNIPFQDQRERFGAVRMCLANYSGSPRGTHVDKSLEVGTSLRMYEQTLGAVFGPDAYRDESGLFDEWLHPLCNAPDDETIAMPSGDVVRTVVQPMSKVGDVVIYDSSAMHSGTPNSQKEDRDVLSIQFSWRNCKSSNDGWGCAECYHCTDKPNWAGSKYGIHGWNRQREKLRDNYLPVQNQAKAIMSRARATVEYTSTMNVMDVAPWNRIKEKRENWNRMKEL